MKRTALVLAFVAASTCMSHSVRTEDKTPVFPNEYGQSGADSMSVRKDECLILAKNCIGADDTVPMRVDRLRREIDKGIAVYSPEELRIMQEQLKWITTEGSGASASM